MISSIILLIKLIREADTFKEFMDALKDPENKDLKKASVFLVITIIFIIILICYLVMFQTLNTPGIHRTMKNSPELIIGNWWCHDYPFMSWRRSGTMIIVTSIEQNYKNPGLNHITTIESVDDINYNITSNSTIKATYDENNVLVLTKYSFDSPGDSNHYRYTRFLSYLILYNIDTDEKLYCKSQPGHIPQSIRRAK